MGMREADGLLKRRGVLAGAAALLGVGLAKLAGGERAEATHSVGTGGPANSDGQALHVDYSNSTTNGTGLSTNDTSHSALTVFNGSPAFSFGQGDALQAITRQNVGYAAGVHGRNHAATGQSIGVLGLTRSTDGTGVYGVSGLLLPPSIPTGAAGVGVYGNGVHGVRGEASTGLGVYGTSTNGIGMAAVSSNSYGLVAQSPNFAGVFYGHHYVTGNLYVAGGKYAAVKAPDGSQRLLHAVEAPEAWFEDAGGAQLVNGKATVRLDPDFAGVVATDEYRVFVTPQGDTKGLYVSQKTPAGFEVREQGGGTNSVAFDYRIIAKRKDLVGRPRLEKVTLPGQPKLPEFPPAGPSETRRSHES